MARRRRPDDGSRRRFRTLIAYVGYDSEFHVDIDRLAGNLAGLATHGLTIPDSWIPTAWIDTAGEVVRRHLLQFRRPGHRDLLQ